MFTFLFIYSFYQIAFWNYQFNFFSSINSKNVLFQVKKALAATNPAVRAAAVGFLGTLHLYMGNNLMSFIDGEKPAVKQQILQELEKNNDEEAPVPTRGMSKVSYRIINIWYIPSKIWMN